jgi:hypothetical protein
VGPCARRRESPSDDTLETWLSALSQVCLNVVSGPC